MNQSGPALILVILGEEWAARAFETILKPRGHAVLRAYTGQQGVALASKIRPDIVMTELRLSDMSATDVCEQIRSLPTVRPSTPIIAFHTQAIGRRERIEHLRSGMWDVFSPPYDAEELLTRVESYLAAKRDVDALVAASQVDSLTGLYNLQGVLQRVQEVVADGARSGRNLSLVIMAPTGKEISSGDSAPSGSSNEAPSDERVKAAAAGLLVDALAEEGANGGSGKQPETLRSLARMMKSTTRLSDSIGRTGETEFVVVAPGIDEKGAGRLAERLLEALEEKREGDAGLGTVGLAAGICTIAGVERGDEPLPEVVLRRARSALEQAQLGRDGIRIHTFGAM